MSYIVNNKDISLDKLSDTIDNMVNTNKKYKSKIASDILYFNGMTLDLYFLSRSFKTTTTNTNPLISIGYFGDIHVKNIVYFLTEIMKNYELITINSSKNKRCLEITENINLNDMIDKLIIPTEEYKKILEENEVRKKYLNIYSVRLF